MLRSCVASHPINELSRTALALFSWCFTSLLSGEVPVSSLGNYPYFETSFEILVSGKLLCSDWRTKTVFILKEMSKFSRKD